MALGNEAAGGAGDTDGGDRFVVGSEYRSRDTRKTRRRFLTLERNAGLDNPVQLSVENAGRDNCVRGAPGHRFRQHFAAKIAVGERQECLSDRSAVQRYPATGPRRGVRLSMSADLRDVHDVVAVTDPQVDCLVGPLVQVLEERHRHLQEATFERGEHAEFEETAAESVTAVDAVE